MRWGCYSNLWGSQPHWRILERRFWAGGQSSYTFSELLVVCWLLRVSAIAHFSFLLITIHRICLIFETFHIFSDNVSQRTFPAQVQAVGGVYPPSCADACAFYGYTMMGTEYGDECCRFNQLLIDILSNHDSPGCGNSTDTASQAPDTDCVMTCSADRDYYCGNANRLSVYQNNPPAETYTNECLAGPLPSWLNVTRLSILASPKEPSTLQTGWNGAVLRIIDVLTVGDTTWSLLSVSLMNISIFIHRSPFHQACQNCNITWIDLSFGNNTDPQGFLVPTVPYPEGIQGPNPSPIISIDLHQGESVIFQTEATLPDGYNGYDGYCASVCQFWW